MSAFVFLHLPKTGGTSVRFLIRRWFTAGEICPLFSGEEWADAYRRRRDPGSFACYCGHLTGENLDQLPEAGLRATILRDPVEHAISGYNHARCRPKSRYFRAFAASGMTFARYVDEVMPHAPKLGHLAQTGRLAGSVRLEAAMARYGHDRASLAAWALDQALRTAERLDGIGFTDDIARFAGTVADALGKPRLPLPRKNARERYPSPAMITPEAVGERTRERLECLLSHEIRFHRLMRQRHAVDTTVAPATAAATPDPALRAASRPPPAP